MAHGCVAIRLLTDEMKRPECMHSMGSRTIREHIVPFMSLVFSALVQTPATHGPS